MSDPAGKRGRRKGTNAERLATEAQGLSADELAEVFSGGPSNGKGIIVPGLAVDAKTADMIGGMVSQHLQAGRLECSQTALAEMCQRIKERRSEEAEWAESREKRRGMPLAMTTLDVRTINSLEKAGLLWVGDLADAFPLGLFEVPNFGRESLIHCGKLLAGYGLADARWAAELKRRVPENISCRIPAARLVIEQIADELGEGSTTELATEEEPC